MKTLFDISVPEFLRSLGSVAMTASEDTTRPYLNSILIRSVDGKREIVATDGHCLALWTDKGNAVDRPDFETLLPLAFVESILRRAKQTKGTLCGATFEREGTRVSVTLGDGTLSADEVTSVHFLPFAQVIPAPKTRNVKNPCQGTGLATTYLMRGAKMFDNAFKGQPEKRDSGVYVEFPEDVESPVVMMREGFPLLFVVMPVRLRSARDRDESPVPAERRPKA